MGPVQQPIREDGLRRAPGRRRRRPGDCPGLRGLTVHVVDVYNTRPAPQVGCAVREIAVPRRTRACARKTPQASSNKNAYRAHNAYHAHESHASDGKATQACVVCMRNARNVCIALLSDPRLGGVWAAPSAGPGRDRPARAGPATRRHMQCGYNTQTHIQVMCI